MAMNLGVITESLQIYGGSEIYLLECVRRWQNEIDIVIYTTKVNRKLLKEFDIDPNRVLVKVLPSVKNKKHRFDLLDSLIIRPRIWERHIGQHDLYFHYLFPSQFVRKSPSIWFAAEPLRMLYDLYHHETVDESRIFFHVYPRMRYDQADKFDLNVMLQLMQELDKNSRIEQLVTNSRMMAGYLQTVYERKVDLVAHPGINLPSVYDGPMNNDTAIFVGRLWNHKRVDLIIKALALLPRGKLLIVGDGPEKKPLKKLVKLLKLKQRVTFMNNLSNAQLDQAYRNAACGVYTPVREPFGIMPLEAASYGMPVVVTHDGGYTEVLDDSCAHIVAPDPEHIAEALHDFFSDHENARKMGAAARKKVENYTWDHTARNLLGLFKRTQIKQQNIQHSLVSQPLLGAHYYPWYGAGSDVRHWNENTEYGSVTDLPVLGMYSSADSSVIEKHLYWIERAGLDYLVVNLQVSFDGLDEREMQAVDLLFESAARLMPELSICFMLSCDNADSNSIESALRDIDEKYTQRENYFHLGSKPVLWFFISESFIGHFYHHYTVLNESTRHYQRIAAAGFCYTKDLPRHYVEFFDSWTLYSPLQISTESTWEALWDASYQDFIEDKQGKEIRSFTLSPGFNDTGLTLTQRSRSQFRDIPREGVKTYERTQNACLRLDKLPELVVITSFNEFHENTNIEPTEATAEKFIDSTNAFNIKLKESVTETVDIVSAAKELN